MEKCLTRAEVAERYQISEEEVAEFEATHRIPVLRFGTVVRYDANALAAFETAARGSSEVEPAEQPAAAPLPALATASPALLDVKEAAARIGCSAQFLRYQVVKHPFYDGQPTHRKVGRKVMFTEADFGRLLETMSAGAPRGPKEVVHLPKEPRRLSASQEYEKALRRLTPKKRKR